MALCFSKKNQNFMRAGVLTKGSVVCVPMFLHRHFSDRNFVTETFAPTDFVKLLFTDVV